MRKQEKEKMDITIGLPRAFLYYRYEILWKIFFYELGIKTIVSPPTNRAMLEQGAALAVDESCLSAKIYFGHVKSLLDKCDFILIPRIVTYGLRRMMCTRFQALYDLTANTFPEYRDHFLVWNIDIDHGMNEYEAFENLGKKLGFSKKEIRKAYLKAKKQSDDAWKEKIKKQNLTAKKEGRKVLVVGHPYVLDDEYIGKKIFDYLRQQGIIILRADVANREEALRKSQNISPTLKWQINRELTGGIEKYKDMVDGILLVTVYPCGPDALADEMILRSYSSLPILHLMLDEQDGTAGIETRIESFLDIIDFKKKASNG